jgi:hypothetical protein
MLSFLPHCSPMLSFLSIFPCSLFLTFLPSLLRHLLTLSFASSVPICSFHLMLSFTLCFSYVYLPLTSSYFT